MSHADFPQPSDDAAIARWKNEMRAEPYRSYLYSYPHKTAYRELTPGMPLAELWAKETAESFFLYMHIPFCGARCGFCNLFTLPDRKPELHRQYVDALERQARQWAPLVSHRPFARFAIGGGTPTLLAPELLDRLFGIAEEVMGLERSQASISVEASPDTVTPERLDILRERRVDRVSMGVQSFVEAESAAIYRPQKPLEVERALDRLRRYDFPVLNLDLIYGLPGQTVQSWLYSLERALLFAPEEIFLYPLYTREHTILKPGDRRPEASDLRMACYIAARDRLLAEGYIQSSMRRFAKPPAHSGKAVLPYGCQEEGLVGLGCGARSYTRRVHYATRYAVSRVVSERIIRDYIAAGRYDVADYGIVLDGREERRRYILKAILHQEGLALPAYEERFGSSALEDCPELQVLLKAEWATRIEETVRLTEEGLAHSDAIGDELISPEVRQRMEGFIFA
ncbi:STM4012 family radical SAM protein [Paenibacillus sp. YN15]|uniref:STM4012 family radical SAM protein n=1 Tax=Paenibacillus sp. YN15 TaxID=1742774 RepID=UPI000DCBF540|nr:coproporphyrinogen III oxidase family protein [Paenibacillus sp. YN15]